MCGSWSSWLFDACITFIVNLVKCLVNVLALQLNCIEVIMKIPKLPWMRCLKKGQYSWFALLKHGFVVILKLTNNTKKKIPILYKMVSTLHLTSCMSHIHGSPSLWKYIHEVSANVLISLNCSIANLCYMLFTIRFNLLITW